MQNDLREAEKELLATDESRKTDGESHFVVLTSNYVKSERI